MQQTNSGEQKRQTGETAGLSDHVPVFDNCFCCSVVGTSDTPFLDLSRTMLSACPTVACHDDGAYKPNIN